MLKCICVYCHTGEQRSVGFAELLAHCLIREGLVEAGPAVHLSRWWWQLHTCSMDGCPACGGPSTARTDALEAAWTAWQALS